MKKKVLIALVMILYCAAPARAQATDPNLVVAFIGDQGLEGQRNENPGPVLDLIKSKGAQLVIHAGDFDYQNSPDRWDQMVTAHLGASFPYLVTAGNHDASSWSKYQKKAQERVLAAGGITCTGDLGNKSHCYYKGLSIILSGIGTLGGGGGGDYIQQEFATDYATWKVCAWHKNQTTMQLGDKADEAGWDVYEACRQAGAIIATGHEHSYSRTKTLTNFPNHTIDTICPDGNTVCVAKGKTFAFVSGLGGKEIRVQKRCLTTTQSAECPQWASSYTSTTPNRGYDFGALFITFNINGDPNKAHGEFITTDNVVRDAFDIAKQSDTTTPPSNSTSSSSDIRVMTFNTGYEVSGHNCSIDPNYMISISQTKVEALATYIVNHHIDVALLQEIHSTCNQFQEWPAILQRLDQLNYHMESYVSKDDASADGNGPGIRTLTLSRFPINTSGVKEFPVSRPDSLKRWGVAAPINLGGHEVVFYNLHTHNTVGCRGVNDFFNVVKQNTPTQPRILGGDFNVDFFSNQWVSNYNDCNQGTADNINAYTLQPSGGFDFIMLPKDQQFQFISTTVDPAGPRSDHKPVISDIRLPFNVSAPNQSQQQNTHATQLKVMTYNFRYFRPHTKPIIANYLKNNQIDIVAFQELQYENGNTIAEMTSALADAGYPMNNVSTSYSPQPEENLAIFYNATKFDLIDPAQIGILSNAGISDVRKIITVKIKDKTSGQSYRIAAHHPVSGENEQSCDQNIKSMQFLDTFNDPNTILIGDFNLQLNTQEAKYVTRCNTLYPEKYWVSCRPGETSQHALPSCDPDGPTANPVNRGIDFVMTNKSGPLKIVDSFYESSAFPKSRTNTGGMSDHFPVVAVIGSGTSQQTQPKEQKKYIKVMTYNVHQDLQKDLVKNTMANSHAQMEDIVNYMMANQIDIAALQEMTNWPALGKSIPDTAVDLDETLKAKNYPMELYWKKSPGSELGHRVVIATRYKAIPESLEAVDTTHERWAPSILINTPVGQIRMMGVHTTYGGTYCPTQTGIIADTIKNHFQSDAHLIAMGDWNVSGCNGAFESNFRTFDKFCTKNCGLNFGLDWIISPPGNVFKMIDGYKDPSKKMSDHIPAVAVLTLKDGQPFPDPIPEPIGGAATNTGTPTSETTSFNVMTFNTESDAAFPRGCNNNQTKPDPLPYLKISEGKINHVAGYIKRLHDQGTDMHVILFQEMYQRCGGFPDFDETLLLHKALADVGYPMDYAALPYERDDPKYHNNNSFRVSTFSVFPIHKDEMIGIPLYEKAHYTDPASHNSNIERWALGVPIDTPFGKIKFYNIHARFQGGHEECDQSKDLFQQVRADRFPITIIGGDFNHLMQPDLTGADSCGIGYGPGTGRSDDYILNDSRTDPIDYLFLNKASNLTFNGSIRDTSGPTSDHLPVYAQVVGTRSANPPLYNGNPSTNTQSEQPDIPEPTPTPEYIDTHQQVPLMGIKLGNYIQPASSWLDTTVRYFTGKFWWREKKE